MGVGPQWPGVSWPQGSESPPGMAHLVISGSRRKEIHPAYGPRSMVSLSKKESVRGAVRADVHRRAPEDLVEPGSAPRLQVQAQGWA